MKRGLAAVSVGAIALMGGCGGSHVSSTGAASTARGPTSTGAATATGAPTATGAATVTRPLPTAGPANPSVTRGHRVLDGRIPDGLPTSQRVVALTFDAGADNAGAPRILAALRRADVDATFFMTGRWAQLYPQWAIRISARYPIGNHTFDHQDLLGLTLLAVRAELVNAAAAIKRATGRPPLPLFRFPYGSSSSGSLALVNKLGYTAVGWTVDTLGWEGTSMGQSIASVTSRALSHLQPGEIILMHVGANPHDHSTLDADALPGIISAIRARGYRFVALSEYF